MQIVTTCTCNVRQRNFRLALQMSVSSPRSW